MTMKLFVRNLGFKLMYSFVMMNYIVMNLEIILYVKS